MPDRVTNGYLFYAASVRADLGVPIFIAPAGLAFRRVHEEFPPAEAVTAGAGGAAANAIKAAAASAGTFDAQTAGGNRPPSPPSAPSAPALARTLEFTWRQIAPGETQDEAWSSDVSVPSAASARGSASADAGPRGIASAQRKPWQNPESAGGTSAAPSPAAASAGPRGIGLSNPDGTPSIPSNHDPTLIPARMFAALQRRRPTQAGAPRMVFCRPAAPRWRAPPPWVALMKTLG